MENYKIQHYAEDNFRPDLFEKHQSEYDGEVVELSTVELRVAMGIDENLKYESMIFSGESNSRNKQFEHSDHLLRYETREEAYSAHVEIVELIEGIDPEATRMPATMHIQEVVREKVSL
jgi:hypothetical protein